MYQIKTETEVFIYRIENSHLQYHISTNYCGGQWYCNISFWKGEPFSIGVESTYKATVYLDDFKDCEAFKEVIRLFGLETFKNYLFIAVMVEFAKETGVDISNDVKILKEYTGDNSFIGNLKKRCEDYDYI